MRDHPSIADGQPIDAETHILCQRLAWALVNRIAAILRPDEINECAKQFYLDIRDHLSRERSAGGA